MPKMRTPQSGLTIRSLSHNLAICSSSEIKPRWVVANFGNPYELSLNVMVVPWPSRIRPVQFRETQGLKSEMRNMPAGFGFFTFDSEGEDEAVVSLIMDLIDSGVAEMGRIDGIILPEMALTSEQHRRISDEVLKKKERFQEERFLVSGVGASSLDAKTHGANRICIDIPRLQPIEQSKHHRWKLDRSQINQYGLGSRLHPERQWWEHINLNDRSLTFVSLLPWLTVTVLICEDLARPDPVGDLVRAVGPNLVIALLMDGPQLKERWGARYATVLADDPGSSVLTLTSVGMCDLSRPLNGPPRGRVIALWKDAKSGSPTEIELPADHDAVVISLSVRYLEEWSADGRSDNKNAGYPLLSGIRAIRRASKKSRIKR